MLKPVNNRRYDALSRIGFEEFERLLADYYRDLGFEVDHCGTGASGTRFDGGIDLKLRKDDSYIVVQCKHWNAKQVTHNAVHELLGIMITQSANGAVLITSGEFTRAAKEAANRQRHVQLVDGVELRRLLGDRLNALPLPPPPPSPRPPDSFNPELVATRSSSRRGRRRAPDPANRVFLKLVAGVALFLVAYWALSSAIETAFHSFGRATTTSVSVPVTIPVAPSPAFASAPAPGESRGDAISAGTYGDPQPELPRRSAAELRREQAAKDAETQRVLDNLKVPEMTHYRYSPLDRDKDPVPEQSR